jgi:hypothetical protein
VPKLTFFFSGTAGKNILEDDLKKYSVDCLISYNEFVRKDCVDRIKRMFELYVELKRARQKK